MWFPWVGSGTRLCKRRREEAKVINYQINTKLARSGDGAEEDQEAEGAQCGPFCPPKVYFPRGRLFTTQRISPSFRHNFTVDPGRCSVDTGRVGYSGVALASVPTAALLRANLPITHTQWKHSRHCWQQTWLARQAMPSLSHAHATLSRSSSLRALSSYPPVPLLQKRLSKSPWGVVGHSFQPSQLRGAPSRPELLVANPNCFLNKFHKKLHCQASRSASDWGVEG